MEALEPPTLPGREVDLAYGAMQRGLYLTAFKIATQRVEQRGDAKAMTLLGELYANGFGVQHDDDKAAHWYRLAIERGDREAMFALAMMRFVGRAGGVDREEAAKLLAAATRLDHPLAAYNLGLLYLEGQLFPRDFARAAGSCSASPPTSAARRRNTRWQRCTRKAAACPRTLAKPDA